jgi:delta-1-pyrroline-5-carboxylate synthetase
MMMLWQLDVASSQLLVTDNDFRDPDFRLQLSETVNSLLELRVVPVFNENDAISTRRAPYQVTKSLWQRMYNLVVYRLFPLHE